MALVDAGVRLNVLGLSRFTSGMRSATTSYTNFLNAGRQQGSVATGLDRASTSARTLGRNLNQAGRSNLGGITSQAGQLDTRLAGAGRQAGGLSTALGGLIGGLGVGALVGFGREISNQIENLVDFSTQATATFNTLDLVSGSSRNAAQSIAIIRDVTRNTVSELQAAALANQLFNLQLAQTPAEIRDFAQATQAIVAISPVINNTDQALNELGLTIANQSTRRLDQLGLSVSEVRGRQRELQAATADLTSEQAFGDAVVGLLTERYAALAAANALAVSPAQQYRAAVSDLRTEFSLFLAEAGTDVLARFFDTGLVESFTASIRDARNELTTQAEQESVIDLTLNTSNANLFGLGAGTEAALTGTNEIIDRIQELRSLDQLDLVPPEVLMRAQELTREVAQTAQTGDAISLAGLADPAILAEVQAINNQLDNVGGSTAMASDESLLFADNLSFAGQEATETANRTAEIEVAATRAADAAAMIGDSFAQSIGTVTSQAAGLGRSVVSAGVRAQSVVGTDQAGTLINAGLRQAQEAAVAIQRRVDAGDVTALQGRLLFEEQRAAILGTFEDVQSNERERLATIRQAESQQTRAIEDARREQIAAAREMAGEFTALVQGIPGLTETNELSELQTNLRGANIEIPGFTTQADDQFRAAIDSIRAGENVGGVNLESLRSSFERFLVNTLGADFSSVEGGFRGLNSEDQIALLEEFRNAYLGSVEGLQFLNVQAAAQSARIEQLQSAGTANILAGTGAALAPQFGIGPEILGTTEQGQNILDFFERTILQPELLLRQEFLAIERAAIEDGSQQITLAAEEQGSAQRGAAAQLTQNIAGISGSTDELSSFVNDAGERISDFSIATGDAISTQFAITSLQQQQANNLQESLSQAGTLTSFETQLQAAVVNLNTFSDAVVNAITRLNSLGQPVTFASGGLSGAGLSLAGEAGRELYRTPRGQWGMFEQPTLFNQPGIQVFSNPQTEQMLLRMMPSIQTTPTFVNVPSGSNVSTVNSQVTQNITINTTSAEKVRRAISPRMARAL